MLYQPTLKISKNYVINYSMNMNMNMNLFNHNNNSTDNYDIV